MPHALLSPSSGTRWISCTPSARLEEGFPDSESEFAKEGTLAHEIGEKLLTSGESYLHISDWKAYKKNPLYTESMYEHSQGYADYVRSFAALDEEVYLFVEKLLDLSHLIPEGFGTGDAAQYYPKQKLLDVFDYKFGKGVLVTINDNTQLKIYALGWVFYLKMFYGFDVEAVRMHIYQPRMDNVGSFIMSVEALNKWADEVLAPKALLAFEGEGEFVPGQHCGFCRAKGQCKALAAYNLELAKYEFQDERLLSPEDTADILAKSSFFISWLNAVTDYALKEAVFNGIRWPGFKIVEGRSKRAYSDERAIASAIMRNLHIGDIYKPKSLLTLEGLKNKIGTKQFKRLVEPLLVKPKGKPTLVPEADPRPVFSSAAEDFKIDFVENNSEESD